MHGLEVYVKKGLLFAQDFSLGNSADSYLYFELALLHSVSYFFFLNRSPSLSLCTVFDPILSNIDEVFQTVNFPTRNPDCDCHSPALLDLFISSLVFVYNGFPSTGKF